MARRVHLSAELQPYPSLALGCLNVSLQESVAAFNIFANNGVYIEPHYIRWVKDAFGVKIYKANPIKERVLDSKISSQVLKVMTLSINRLRKTIGEKWFGGDAVGKTGTTNDSRICWFCGSTPELTTAIYVSSDENQSLGQKVYGSKTAFPIWFAMSRQLPVADKHFYYDPSLKEVTVDSKTGQIVSEKIIAK
jgi:penicillin-binding protein 1A